MKQATVPLAQVIAALRSELETAQAEGAGKALRFEVGDVEVEFQVVVMGEVGATGGINIRVFSLGASGKHNQAETQRITLKLTPKTNGGTTNVSDQIPRPK